MPDDKAMRAHGQAMVETFFTQVEQAFAFLPAAYHFTLHERRSDSLEAKPSDTQETFVDAEAVDVYLSDHLEVDLTWGFAIATMRVTFVELLAPGVSPSRRYAWGARMSDAARMIYLETLAAARGHGSDPDFLLGDVSRVDGRSINRRFKLLQTNMAGVIGGLTRATEQYASDILQGDTSIFPEVMRLYGEQRRAQGHW
jgi:hypothetical protein